MPESKKIYIVLVSQNKDNGGVHDVRLFETYQNASKVGGTDLAYEFHQFVRETEEGGSGWTDKRDAWAEFLEYVKDARPLENAVWEVIEV